MGATVDWGIVARFMLEAVGAFLVVLGLSWWAWIRYWQRWRLRVRARRYWREHPYYEPGEWQQRQRRRRRRQR